MKDGISLWTAFYKTDEDECYWRKFGHRDGPPIDKDVIKRLSVAFIKNKPGWHLMCILPGGPWQHSLVNR